MRGLLAALAAGALGGTAAAATPVLQKLAQGGTLVLGHRESSTPFSYVDGTGRPVGYALDICQRLAEAMRRELKLASVPVSYKLVTPATRMALVQSHQVDLECGSTTNNAERRQTVAFTVPHYITGSRLLVRSDSALTELRQFEGRRLVSTRSTTSLKALQAANADRLMRIQIIEAPDHAGAVDMVEKAQADGFVMDDVLLYALMSSRPDPSRLKVVGKMLTVEPLAIMMAKDDPDLKRLVDEEMKRLIRSQELHGIYTKWFERPIPPHGSSLNLPMNHLLRDFWKFPSDYVPF